MLQEYSTIIAASGSLSSPGLACLHISTLKGNLQLMGLLLRSGADINVQVVHGLVGEGSWPWHCQLYCSVHLPQISVLRSLCTLPVSGSWFPRRLQVRWGMGPGGHQTPKWTFPAPCRSLSRSAWWQAEGRASRSPSGWWQVPIVIQSVRPIGVPSPRPGPYTGSCRGGTKCEPILTHWALPFPGRHKWKDAPAPGSGEP